MKELTHRRPRCLVNMHKNENTVWLVDGLGGGTALPFAWADGLLCEVVGVFGDGRDCGSMKIRDGMDRFR